MFISILIWVRERYRNDLYVEGALRMIEQLSDSVLLEAYKKAKQNQLEEDFLAILEQELMRRDIHMNELNR